MTSRFDSTARAQQPSGAGIRAVVIAGLTTVLLLGVARPGEAQPSAVAPPSTPATAYSTGVDVLMRELRGWTGCPAVAIKPVFTGDHLLLAPIRIQGRTVTLDGLSRGTPASKKLTAGITELLAEIARWGCPLSYRLKRISWKPYQNETVAEFELDLIRTGP